MRYSGLANPPLIVTVFALEPRSVQSKRSREPDRYTYVGVFCVRFAVFMLLYVKVVNIRWAGWDRWWEPIEHGAVDVACVINHHLDPTDHD